MLSSLIPLFASVLLVLPAAPSVAQDKLNDPQIAHIAYTAGALDVEAAKQALAKSKNKDVVEFATLMQKDHEAVNGEALKLVKKLNVTPEDNAVSKSLTKASQSAETKLAKLSGAEFDKAYILHEITYHKQVNQALEQQLIPGAKNQEIKGFLETGLKLFQGHEQHAEHVAAMLK